jgi:MFS family permease
MSLFRIRPFAAGNVANLAMALSRGGMQFMLIIWLQGIWLPLHGYSFSQTPLWAGIYLIPLTIGFLLSAPLSGILSDHFGAKPFTIGGALVAAVTFLALAFLPVNFTYWQFALLVAVNGMGTGLFVSPNRAEMMNSVPANQRGAAAGMIATFMNSASVLSIGIFFSLMVAGLSSKLPATMFSGLTAQGVPASAAAALSHLPPIGVLFAAFLGYNPIQQLLGPLVSHLSPVHAAYVIGRQFFPSLITGPFHDGIGVAFGFAIAACVIGAVGARVARLRDGRRGRRGKRYRAERTGYPRGPGGRGRTGRQARQAWLGWRFRGPDTGLIASSARLPTVLATGRYPADEERVNRYVIAPSRGFPGKIALEMSDAIPEETVARERKSPGRSHDPRRWRGQAHEVENPQGAALAVRADNARACDGGGPRA